MPVFTLLGTNFNITAAWPTPIELAVVDDCGVSAANGSVVTTFSNNDPALSMSSQGNGRWSATWPPRNARSADLTISAQAQLPEKKIAGATQIKGSLKPNPNVPVISSGGVVGAASYDQAPGPGTLVSIFGGGLADGVGGATKLPLDTRLQNTEVFLAGQPLPLIFTSDGQVNAILPYELPGNTRQQLIVKRGTSLSVPEPLVIAETQPAIFSTDLTGKGQGHIYRITATGEQILAAPGTPAKAGDALVIF